MQISDLYKCDPLGLELSKEFWSVDESDRYDSQTSFAGSSRHQVRLQYLISGNTNELN